MLHSANMLFQYEKLQGIELNQTEEVIMGWKRVKRVDPTKRYSQEYVTTSRSNGMKKVTYLTKAGVVLFLLFGTLSAQPDTLWTRTYGSAGSDYGWSVLQTPDNGFIMSGITNSYGAGSYDVYLVKTDANGDVEWTKTYGGPGWDEGWSIEPTADSGYIIVGWTESYGSGQDDVYLLKTDADGDTLWTQTYGGAFDDIGRSVKQTNDGYIIAGCIDPYGAYDLDLYLVKTDTDGDLLWTKMYGGPSAMDGARAVQVAPDSCYVIAGWTATLGTAGSEDVWLLKTDTEGDTIWTKTYGGPDWDEARSMQKTTDGGYIITGVTSSFGAGGSDIYLIKTDADGDTLWTRTYGGTGDDYGNYVQQTTDDGYIITGYTQSYGPGWFNLYVVKTDANGDTLWTQVYGGTELDFGYSVQQTSDHGYIIAGQTGSFGAGGDDAWLIRLAPEPGIEETGGGVVPASYVLSQSYPNPFTTETAIHFQLSKPNAVTIAIYDVAGQLIQTLANEPRAAGDHVVHWDGRSQDGHRVSNGVYFCRMNAGGYISAIKILLMR
jgi:hypothetical protein